MNESDLRLALTGALPLALLIASVLAVPLSFLVLGRYRAAVVAAMLEPAGSGNRPDMPRETPGPPPDVNLVVEAVGDETAPVFAHAGPWRLAALYCLAGAIYAAAMTAAVVLADDQIEGNPLQVAALALGYLWPTVMVVLFVAAYDRTRRLQVLAAYAATWVVLMSWPPIGRVGLQALALVFLVNVVPTILVLGFSVRSIRTVGLLVLSTMFLVALGAQAIVWFTATSEHFLFAVVEVGHMIGLGAKSVVATLVALGFLIGALLSRSIVRAFARRYDERKFSDQMLMADAHFLVFGVVQSVTIAALYSAAWFAAGLIAFSGYKLAEGMGLRALRGAQAPPRSLLLLRVFKLGPRSERLFDRLRRHWLHDGPVKMIAGPDLVTSTVEPYEVLDFLAGRLDRRFVLDMNDLHQRLALQRGGTDPDGRYRIETFFCRADNWRGTMQLLARECDAVLMDLRSFAPDSQGCLYEIGQLLDTVDLRRVLFIVDGSTRRAFLTATLQDLWRHVRLDSPNRSITHPTVQLFEVEEPSEQVLLRLCAALTSRRA